MVTFSWPNDPVPDLSEGPLLEVIVTTPRDQARLHRDLCRAGYVPELLYEGVGADVYRFVHPDGERPE